MAGFATPTSFAGHANRSARAHHELTFKSDHQSGAGHCGGPQGGRMGVEVGWPR
jgi:hypothetical protein